MRDSIERDLAVANDLRNMADVRTKELRQVCIDAENRLEFASDVCRNQQLRINELEQRVKLLLRYVDHLRGCKSYTNGACSCGFEKTMREIENNAT